MSRSVEVRRAGFARGAGLLVLLACSLALPAPASAQLGELIVTITSPTAGSTVGGTITVSANVSIIGSLTVSRVEFQLDGVLLAEDATAPYSVPWNTKTTGNGSHTLVAVGRTPLGAGFHSDPVTVTVFNDTTPPTVSITSPPSGAAVTGTITVTANASDNVGVAGVRFQLDGANLGAEDTTAPYSVPWNTATATPGSHTLRALARDAAGNSTTSAGVTVTVPDTTAPTAAITSPAPGATVTGTITVSANASDNVGVVGVQFQLDGVALGAEDTTSPYSVPWNTATATPGSHTLRAMARDAAGNSTTSSSVTVTVPDTTAPTVAVTSPAPGATVMGTITVSANASDNVGVAGVQFQIDGVAFGPEDTTAPYSIGWDTTRSADGNHAIRAVARDGAGNTTTSSSATVTVSNGTPPDATPPSVAITSPASGATVTGTITVSANASDNIGVVGVQFQLDGAALGAEDTTSPYSIPWNTTTATPGSHTLRAVARDAAGNNTTSAAVTVTVPDTTAPTVAVTSPASGATVTGTITVSAGASDNVGVAGVQFQLDGVSFGPEDDTAPYSIQWDTTSSANGSHTVTAVARDAAGNTASSSASVSVSNGTPPDTAPPAVSVTAPGSGATVSGTTTVTASASDNVGVVGVQFRLDGAPLGVEDTTAPYAITWDTASAANGNHSLTAVARDAANNTATSSPVTVTVSNAPPAGGGDVFVALIDGTVQWRNPDGSLRTILDSPSDGQISSLAFDAAGNLYVPHWWGRSPGVPGNYMVRFDPAGNFLGAFGSGYDCSPSSMAFDAQGNVYVGQAECTGDILKFDAAGNLLASFDVATGSKGTDHIDLATDGCTMFYASRTQDIFRFDVCTNTQLPRFNAQPLPGEAAFHLRILPDGGVLVADAQVIVRLDASGNQVRMYSAPGEPNYWGGLDLAGEGTFWATNAFNGNVYKFDLTSGAVLASFNTGTGAWTAAGVAIRTTGGGGGPTPPGDTTSPAATITSPGSGSTVSGTITVSATASDDVGVSGVRFQLDGAPLGVEDTTAPYSVTWDTGTAANGAHTLTAIARDAAGNTSTSSSVPVTVSNVPPSDPPADTTAPAVTVTSPGSGSTVSGSLSVSASASDDVGVAAVQFRLDGAPLGAEDTTAPYSVAWDTRTAPEGTHTLTAVARDAAGNTATSSPVTVTVSNPPPSGGGGGDVFVALIDGTVQWRNPDGSLRTILDSPSDGQISSLAFDAARNLYVPHWWGRSPGVPGNTMVRFDEAGTFLGTFGRGYDCSPSSVAFDAQGDVYVGQAECTGDILKFDAAGNPLGSFDVAVGNKGTDHIDLATDGCTMFYASRTQDIFRFDVCTNTQLPRFNAQPLPGEAAFHLRILPDGGVLVADAQVIVRLDASGNQVRMYSAPGEPNYWGGLDLAGEGTFWATNAFNGNVYKFDLASGAVLASFNTGTGAWTAAGVAVKP